MKYVERNVIAHNQHVPPVPPILVTVKREFNSVLNKVDIFLFQNAALSRVGERSKDFAKSWTRMAEGKAMADLFNFRDWAKL